MNNLSVSPYYHPTTVVLVDDNLDFLSNLSLQLDAHVAYRLFDSPEKALTHLNNNTRSRSLRERFFSTIDNNRFGLAAEPVLRLDLAAIQREVRNTQRFAETAVVIADYSMPQMSGIDFCKKIQNPYIKKILFTGVADENIAIRAFNEGIIDRFIRKSERDVYDDINTAITELQTAYIHATAHTVNEVLSLGNEDCLSDPEFVDFFQQLRAQHKFIEYYRATEPNGFLLVDAEGHTARLITLTDDDLDLQSKVARSRGAPQALLDSLDSGTTVPYFSPSADGFYHPECTSWSDNLHPSQILESNKRYHWALVHGTGAPDGAEIASYLSYLDWLDTTGYALI